jgi:HPt (histidine-containing phosphotransfer) domain-containing protein
MKSEEIKEDALSDEEALEKIEQLMKNSQIEEINFDEGIMRMGGNATIFLRVIRLFVKNIPALLSKTSQDLASKNIFGYMTTVHGIKGSCYGVAVNNLGDEAQELEQAAKTGDLAFIEKHHKNFEAQISCLVEKLEKLFKEIDIALSENDKRELKKNPDKNLLEKLLIASENFDYNEIQILLDELTKFRYENDAEKIEKIKSNAAEFSYDGICQVIRTIL